MAKKFEIYKGCQKPLIYRGFQGKFIGWGIASLVSGLLLGGVIGSLFSMAIGGFVCIGVIVGGLLFTANHQKKGLHSKTRHVGVFQLGVDFSRLKRYEKKKDTV